MIKVKMGEPEIVCRGLREVGPFEVLIPVLSRVFVDEGKTRMSQPAASVACYS